MKNKYKKTVALILILIMVILLGTSCNGIQTGTIEAAQVKQLEKPLTAILDQYLILKMPYPTTDSISNNYAISYLITLVNSFYADRAKPNGQLKTQMYEKYMAFTQTEINDMLNIAFGDRITAADLDLSGIENGSIALVDGTYYFGLGMGSLAKITYEEAEDVAYNNGGSATFAYQSVEMGAQPKSINGTFLVKFIKNDNNKSGINIVDFVPDETLQNSFSSKK